MLLTILGMNGPYPAAGSACSGYLLSSDSGNTNLLIDFGPGCLAQLPRHIAYEKLDAVFLSHLHYDHMSDMLPLQYAIQFHPRTEPLPVYCPDSPVSARDLLNAPCYALHSLSSGEEIRIGEFSLSFLPVRHPVPTFAMRVQEGSKVFVYTGDTNTLPGLADFARGAALLLADAGFADSDWNEKLPHLSAALCAQLAKEAKAESLILTHFNPRYTADTLLEEARAVFDKTAAASVGGVYRI